MKLEDLTAANLTDDQLARLLSLSTRNTLILALVFSSILALLKGWPTGLLLLIGGLISASGINEWRRLVRAINASMDAEEGSKAPVRVAVLFLVRLALAVGVLYVSLKFLHGSPFALVGGLSLAAIALCYQTLQLLRQ